MPGLQCSPVNPQGPILAPSRSVLQLLLPRADPTAGSLRTGCASRQTRVSLFFFFLIF